MTWAVWDGDVLVRMKELDEHSVEAVVCDPPYGLEFMGKDWDAPWRERDGFRRAGNPADVGRDNAFGRLSACGPEYRAGTGFQAWCSEWAREILRVLKPGGHLLAFGGTRTYHRLAAGVEDAGFEIRDCLTWLYGSGFPKSLDVAKAIDIAAEAARQVVSEGRAGASSLERTGRVEQGYRPNLTQVNPGAYPITAPATREAARWHGWGTALKPGHEPIVVARKPLAGTVAQNVLKHSTGALNVDGCRIEGTKPGGGGAPPLRFGGQNHRPFHGEARLRGAEFDTTQGRWPANVVLSHTKDCVAVGIREVASDGHYPAARPAGSQVAGASGHVGQEGLAEHHTRGERATVWDCAPGCPVRMLDEQTGTLTSGRLEPHHQRRSPPPRAQHLRHRPWRRRLRWCHLRRRLRRCLSLLLLRQVVNG